MRKHLNREQFQELVSIVEEAAPDSEVCYWLKRAFCMNDGDSTLHACSLLGHQILQWHTSEFDEEDDMMYEQWYGDGEEDWDFSDDDE
jgi:hypothetical protein